MTPSEMITDAPREQGAAASAPHEEAAAALAERRAEMQRYRERNATLPYETMASCPGCAAVTAARFQRNAGGQIVLHYDCAACGEPAEVHDDGLWTAAAAPRRGSARQTLAGHTIRPNRHGLPRTVETLCPECAAVIVGRYFVRDGAVLIEKCCPEHGYVQDIVNRDVRLFLKGAYWHFDEQAGLANAADEGARGCPSDCGLCGRHQSCSCLANVDLTNRCNLNCPICFANANAVGYVYEPTFEQVEGMLQALRDMRPTPATAVQFSGGEPTLYPRFFDIVARAAAMGFSNIQIATNGLKMADYEFAARARDAGLHTLYLQFDGVGPEAYRQTRGRDIWEYKLATVENCRRAGMKICLVPTIVRTVNDDQVGEIFRFATANVDVVSAISYQPVCFTGRIGAEERLRQRYTLGDLAHDLAAASGAVVERDFYPLSIVMPLAQMLESATGKPKIKPSCHTDCALGTYFLVDERGRAYPFPQVLDVERMFSEMHRWAKATAGHAGRLTWWDKLRLVRVFQGAFRPGQAPPGLTVRRFVQALQGMVDKNKGRGAAGRGNYRTLMAAGMHFQDRYNYDIERVKRCVIPYSTPLGMAPFCAYNGGPTYRPLIERAFARQDG